jgi:osmotically inducible protein OsmC
MAERRAEVIWEGNLTQGHGTIVSVGSGAFGPLPVTWASRVEEPAGKTSPEELLAAAHAACYSMALSNTLNQRGAPPERLHTTAVCTIERVEGAMKITTMRLTVRGRVPGTDNAGFVDAATTASRNCPVSKALAGNVDISVDAALE